MERSFKQDMIGKDCKLQFCNSSVHFVFSAAAIYQLLPYLLPY